MYPEEDYLQISGLQHFVFCQRQWALIHIEKQWFDNLRTVEGEMMHKRAHDSSIKEMRGETLSVHAVQVSSSILGVSGECDVVEYHRDDKGITLAGHLGLWQPYPIEYKRGKIKETNADRLQLCCQAMCLEEMLCCTVDSGALFYGETKKREKVVFSKEMRADVKEKLLLMHRLMERGHTPKVKTGKHCYACSLKDICLPVLNKVKTVSDYISSAMEE